MDSHVWLTLFLAALINAAIPGPILLLVMARAAGGGLRSGLRTALGGALAVALLLTAIWALLFGAWQLGSGLVSALKITGIGVLTILGLRMLRAIPSRGAPLPTRAAASDLGAGLAIGLFSPFNLLLPSPATATRNPRDHDAGGIALASALVLLGSVLPLGAAAAVGAGQARLSPGGRAGWSAAAA